MLNNFKDSNITFKIAAKHLDLCVPTFLNLWAVLQKRDNSRGTSNTMM